MIKKLTSSAFIILGFIALLFSFSSCQNKKANSSKHTDVKKDTITKFVILDTVKKAVKEKYTPVPDDDMLNNKVYPQYKVTYMDLLRQIFHEIQKDKYGDVIALKTIPIRNIVTSEPEISFRDTIKIAYQDKFMIKSSGKSFILLICRTEFTSGQHPYYRIANGRTVMCLFDPGSGKLLDAADVTSDKQTGLDKINSRYTLPLGSKQEAVAVWNTHNTRGYNNCSIITIVNNKLKEVFNFFFWSYRLECEEFDANPNFVFSKGGAKPFGDVYITIKGTTIKNGETYCKGKKRTIIKNYKSHLIWNPTKKVYEDKLKDFALLENQNQANL